MSKKNCIIYGGAGFIGSHVADSLLKNGFSVTIFDKLNASTKNISHILNRITFIEGDFNNRSDVKKSLQGNQYAVHLVSSTLPAGSNINPAYDVETNLISSINMLEECTKQEIRKIIFISSGGTVYGEPESLPITESHPTKPINSYGIIKLAIEKYFELYRNLKGLNCTILRFSNPFGERQNPKTGQGIIPSLLYKIKHNETLEIWGDGSVIRDYFYIKDGAKAVTAALQTNSHQSIFNIGSGRGLSVNDIIKKFQTVLKLHFDLKYSVPRKFDVKENILDISLAKKHLHWKPAASFDTALKRTWKYIREH
jgi:UDP-glucose 4-epimerase